MALNPKQTRFVEEYLLDLNASKAAVRAGYSAKTADQQGYQLLQDTSVSAAIQAAQAARSERTKIDADRVVQELTAMAIYDPADIAKQGMAGPEDIAKLPEQVRRAIVGWGWDKQGNFTLKLSPKTPSLDLLGRHLGMFKSQIEHTGKDGAALVPAIAVTINRD
jgi:phage terminase small subunit